MTDISNTIDTYLAAYNETDAATRRELIGQAFAADAHLVDPPLDGTGRDGISTMMGTVQSQFPGHRFRRTSAVDEHHGYFRYRWALVNADGEVVLAGQDVGAVDGQGQLLRVIGFFGDATPLPEAA